MEYGDSVDAYVKGLDSVDDLAEVQLRERVIEYFKKRHENLCKELPFGDVKPKEGLLAQITEVEEVLKSNKEAYVKKMRKLAEKFSK